MKPKRTNENPARGQIGMTFGNACVASCRKALAQFHRAKAAIFAESFHALRAPERLLRLALNEAEALALQTGYPHLFFPVLATEKVQAVMNWNDNQPAVRKGRPIHPIAA